MPSPSTLARARVLKSAVATVALASLAWSLPASAQEGGEGPPRSGRAQPAFKCETNGNVLPAHNLKQGEINIPVQCTTWDNEKQQTIYVAPKKVQGTITVSAGIRERLGLSSTRVASGTFSGPTKTKDGHEYYHFWIKMTSAAQAKLKSHRVGALSYSAELTVTWPDGSNTDELTATNDAYRNYGACKLVGRMAYGCAQLP